MLENSYFVAWHAYSWMNACWLRRMSKPSKKSGGPPRVWGKCRPMHTEQEKYGTWKSALVRGVLEECLPYAIALHKMLLSDEEQKRSAALPEVQLFDSFFSYIGLKIYGDARAAKECPAIVVEKGESNVNEKAGTSRGLVLHFDNSNYGFGYVFVFGTFRGFEQLYPKLGLKLICPTLAYTCCEFDKILHGVGEAAVMSGHHQLLWPHLKARGQAMPRRPFALHFDHTGEGTGVRMCVVFAVHRAMATGEGVEGAPYSVVDFTKKKFSGETKKKKKA